MTAKQIDGISNPRWLDAEHTAVTMTITFKDAPSKPLPFTAVVGNNDPTVKLVLDEVNSGKYGAIGPYVPAVPYPLKVYAVQALLALKDAGLYDIVDTACKNHPLKEVQIWYEKAQTWEEDNPYVMGIGAELGLTDAQVHNLFLAATLK